MKNHYTVTVKRTWRVKVTAESAKEAKFLVGNKAYILFITPRDSVVVRKSKNKG